MPNFAICENSFWKWKNNKHINVLRNDMQISLGCEKSLFKLELI